MEDSCTTAVRVLGGSARVVRWGRVYIGARVDYCKTASAGWVDHWIVTAMCPTSTRQQLFHKRLNPPQAVSGVFYSCKPCRYQQAMGPFLSALAERLSTGGAQRKPKIAKGARDFLPEQVHGMPRVS